MKFVETSLPGVLVVEPTVFGDSRGFFFEVHHAGKFAAAGVERTFVQSNHSRSAKGILRGLHIQTRNVQGKLVRVVRGSVWDVAVDVRPDSPHFGRWFGTELSEDDKRALWVPEGFAHGFVVTSEVADVVYMCTDLYSPEHERVLAWNDPTVGIAWPVSDPKLNARDAAGLPLDAFRASP
ncbi:MAG: dTDP-4-dehydrorhamnose 3,5-epimerase [Polyangiaceae bacterium]